MTLIGVSFSIHIDDTHEQRKDDLLQRLRTLGKTWNETNDLVLIKTRQSIAEVRFQVLLALNVATDKSLIFRTDEQILQTTGQIMKPLL